MYDCKDLFAKIKRIADAYGYGLQTRQCMEELGELAQAINKHYKYVNALPFGGEDMACECRNRVIDEIADVQIMLWQMSYFLNAGKEVTATIAVKLQEAVECLDDYVL